MNMYNTVFGFPKIGSNRELKKALEAYWSGKISEQELINQAQTLTLKMAKKAFDSGIDIVPSNEFSLYDFVLDVSVMFNAIPERFRKIKSLIDLKFAMARGTQDAQACEMTKWFNTNYHYIVPELDEKASFSLTENKTLDEYTLIKEKLNIETKPVILGPFTYLKLSKINRDLFEKLFPSLINSYCQLIAELCKAGVKYIQIDEPAFVLDLEDWEIDELSAGYKKIASIKGNSKLFVQTYYESLSKFEQIVYSLPVDGIGLDFVDGKENADFIVKYGFPKDKTLIAGIVSGRDPWRTNMKEALRLIEKLASFTDNRLILSNSCPLFHLPVSLKPEQGHIPEEVLKRLCFAEERLEELTAIKEFLKTGKTPEGFEDFPVPSNNKTVEYMENSTFDRNPEFKVRYKLQRESLKLPLFPTTTIGSFPQTNELRAIRAKYKKGDISADEYQRFIFNEIKKAIQIQEEVGLDVLVHGEFERTDMVEFFAERLDGFICTKNGWVQSYGSRCVKPPIIYADISRPNPLTLKETLYAKSLTNKPVKGILTGAVTILQWSFYRKDIPKKEIAYQIALALREEVLDLESSGIKIIQIDEPAFREGLPLKKKDHEDYFDWAIKSFKITSSSVMPTTQIHTHMCYSEFNEIIEKIYALDADVISIEASRSKGDILKAFEKFNYDHGIGLGVYDIHSPRIPSQEEMLEIVNRAIKFIDKNLFWINPDCGLKTRNWEEVIPSLKNMVETAKIFRKKEA
ncbi:5-methyltetrahydropteroyltriglutamate--homocysteine S-methyltransferase [Thermodesulfovibrio hydrogeniphilus]